MDPVLIATLTLRGIAAVMAIQGRPEVSSAITVLLDAHRAGRNIDAHMRHMTEMLEADAPLADWDELTNRINRVTAEFLDDDQA